MLSSKSSLSVFKCARLLIIFLLLFPCRLYAQLGKTLPDNSVIKLHFDEKGKMITPFPIGFAVVEDASYSFEITVDAPTFQHKQLIKYFSKKLLILYDKLRDPTDTVAKTYSRLFPNPGSFSNYVQEVKSLYDILSSDDPEGLLGKAGPNEFPHFHKTAFLKKVLFDEAFSVEVLANQQPVKKTGSYKVASSIAIPSAKYSVNKVLIEVRVQDMIKSFTAAFFKQSRTNVAQLLDTLRAGAFYNLSVKEISPLLDWRNELMTKLDTTKLLAPPYFCTPAFNSLFQKLNTYYPVNPLIKLIKTDWLLYWAWYNDGALRLNPFDFTDENLLALDFSYDKDRAKRYDKYIKASISRMTAANSNVDISLAKFDSLNRQFDKGKEVYSESSKHPEIKKKNKAAFEKMQQSKLLIDSIIFRVVDADFNDDYFMKVFNAANALTQSKSTDLAVIPLKKDVEIMTYNIKADQKVQVAVTAEDIKDESDAVAQINSVADLSSALAAAVLPVKSSVVNASMNFNGISTVPKVLIKPNVVDTSTSRKGLADKTVYTYYLEVESHKGKLVLVTKDEDRNPFDIIDISPEIDKVIRVYKLDGCGSLASDIRSAVSKEFLNFTEKIITDYAGYISFRDITLARLSKRAGEIVLSKINKVSEKYFEQIRDDYALLHIAANLVSSGNYVLPPKTLDSEDDPTPSAYYNQYDPVPVQKAAKEINISLALQSKKDGKLITPRTDSYKVSSPHYITASMGLAFVFNRFRRSDVTVTNGVISNTPDEDRLRLTAGINIYPVPILLTDSRNIFKLKKCNEILSRFSFYLGVSFPKAFYNPMVGATVEVWPGVKTTAGFHFYRRTSHTVINDQITDERSDYTYNSPFVSLSIEPGAFVKFLGLIK